MALARVLRPVADEYDVSLIDCQPSLGLLTVNALAASHGVIIPLECEFFALRGVALLIETVEASSLSGPSWSRPKPEATKADIRKSPAEIRKMMASAWCAGRNWPKTNRVPNPSTPPMMTPSGPTVGMIDEAERYSSSETVCCRPADNPASMKRLRLNAIKRMTASVVSPQGSLPAPEKMMPPIVIAMTVRTTSEYRATFRRDHRSNSGETKGPRIVYGSSEIASTPAMAQALGWDWGENRTYEAMPTCSVPSAACVTVRRASRRRKSAWRQRRFSARQSSTSSGYSPAAYLPGDSASVADALGAGAPAASAACILWARSTASSCPSFLTSSTCFGSSCASFCSRRTMRW